MAETTSPSPAPHAIRLRLAWECEPMADWRREDDAWQAALIGSSDEPQRIALPWRAAFAGGAPVAQLCLRRFFNRPTGLETVSRVELVVDALQFDFPAEARAAFGAELPRVEICLNDECLGAFENSTERWHRDITQRLRSRNALEVIAHIPPPLEEQKGVFALGEVRLEIR